MNKPETLIEIIMDGGVIHEVLYPEGAPVRVVVKDYDTEGLDPDDGLEVDDEGNTFYRTEW